MSKTVYTEMTRAKVSDTRSIVISDCSKGGYTIAQELLLKDGDHKVPMFVKGAFHINDINGLHELRDCINLAISIIEERAVKAENDTDDEDDWDS